MFVGALAVGLVIGFWLAVRNAQYHDCVTNALINNNPTADCSRPPSEFGQYDVP